MYKMLIYIVYKSTDSKFRECLLISKEFTHQHIYNVIYSTLIPI
jgi:hypothetical protein